MEDHNDAWQPYRLLNRNIERCSIIKQLINYGVYLNGMEKYVFLGGLTICTVNQIFF